MNIAFGIHDLFFTLIVNFQQPEKRPTAKIVSNHLMRLERKLEGLGW